MTIGSNRLHTCSIPALSGLLLIFLLGSSELQAQKDTLEQNAKDTFFLLRYKGILGKLGRSIIRDTAAPDPNLQRIDKIYERFRGRIIRRIDVNRLDFGVPLNDTSKSFKNTLTRVADFVHHETREYVIRNNLFFKEGDTLLPILLADNERHLRDQTYIGDAKIIVRRVVGSRDSVDVIVLTKDVLSVGGRFKMGSLTKVETAVREDNFMGWGDRLAVSAFYDQIRNRRWGSGAEYVARNMGGSFADASFGFLDFANSFNTFNKQETNIYGRVIKPLVNPYMKWTYALEGGWHKNKNRYFEDSLYKSDYQYEYYNIDAWGGLNLSAHQLNKDIRDERLRTLVGLRFLHQEFSQVPEKYREQYFYQYANITGVLASMSLFRQDFYKTQYVYGFGRNEDVPEGLNVGITTGYTNKQQRERPYFGLDLGLNYFSRHKNYWNYTFRAGGYSYKRKYEDISLLFNVEFFSRLRQLSKSWRLRTFLSAGLTTQLNKQLNEPLLLESVFGLSEYQNINLGGDHRLTIKGETVFFNDFSLINFRFAPFVFGNGSLITPVGESLKNTKLYGTLGAGIRSRNESLVFGTLELRAYYFPGKNFNGDSFRIDFNTNIRFKYNNQFIRRPDFITVN
ncbi:MAG TPA: hypothetical protein VK618_09280 [Flavitalea sp.]|nr:hypothetical protein [Flavitalea sp.]